MRRHVLYVAAPACLLLGLPVAARADIAPTGSASATALRIGSVLGVSNTGATAQPGTADAEASVIEVGGEPILGTGGSQTSTGQTGGALVEISSTPPAQVQVAPWEATATGSAADSTRSSSASAAAARAEVPEVAKLGVLQSESRAEHRSAQSLGSGSSDAIDLGLADIARLILLHSEVNSEGRGSSYLVGLNGTEIGTDEQLGEVCAFEATGLLGLSCLQATGGPGGGLIGGGAELLGLTSPLAAALDPVSAFTADATSGSGSDSVLGAVAETPAAGTETERAVTPAAAPSDVAGEGLAALPRTGVTLAATAAAALAALMAGAALRLFGRRRVTA